MVTSTSWAMSQGSHKYNWFIITIWYSPPPLHNPHSSLQLVLKYCWWLASLHAHWCWFMHHPFGSGPFSQGLPVPLPPMTIEMNIILLILIRNILVKWTWARVSVAGSCILRGSSAYCASVGGLLSDGSGASLSATTASHRACSPSPCTPLTVNRI